MQPTAASGRAEGRAVEERDDLDHSAGPRRACSTAGERRQSGRNPHEQDKKDPLQAGHGSRRHAATLVFQRADVAELVDAHGSGPCGGDPVEVQVLSSAYPT
jgi:hypothetical protein